MDIGKVRTCGHCGKEFKVLLESHNEDDCISELREENAKLRQIVKGVHGALTDAATVVVPGDLLADLYAPVMQIVKERDEARAAIVAALDESTATKVLKLRVEELLSEVARLEGLILDWYENADDEPTWQALVVEAKRIRAQREECRHGGRQQGETPCPDCSAQREEGR